MCPPRDSVAYRNQVQDSAHGRRQNCAVFVPRSSCLLDADAFPERHAACDVARCRFWVGIIPSRIGIRLAVNLNRVIARDTLPRTHAMRLAGPEEFFMQRLSREVMVALDNLRAVRFR